MKKDHGKEPVAEHRNGHRNPNSPVLTAFDSNEEIDRDISDKDHIPKRKKSTTEETPGKKKKKKKPGKGSGDHTAN